MIAIGLYMFAAIQQKQECRQVSFAVAVRREEAHPNRFPQVAFSLFSALPLQYTTQYNSHTFSHRK